MSLKLGNNSIGSLYLGNTKISQAYLGSVKVYESSVAPVVLPAYTLRYKFYTSGFDPTTLSQKGTWTQVSSSPNVWDWTYQNTDWSYGPFRTNQSYQYNALTGLYDIIAAGDNTGVSYLDHFFGYQLDTPATDPYNGPVRVCDLHISPSDATGTGKFGLKGFFRHCSTLEYFEGNIDLSHSLINFQYMFGGTSITTMPPFTGTITHVAGNDLVLTATYMFYNCQYLTDISNLSTIDIRFDDLTAMSPNDGWNICAAFHGCPNLTITGTETNGWNANAVPLKLFGDDTSSAGITFTSDLVLSSNKVNIFKLRLRNAARFKYCFDNVGLTTVPDFTTFAYTGCDFSYCFRNNYNVTSGALAAYTRLSSLAGNIGPYCFSNCGSDTQTGQADLDQIPESWGGNLVVQDYYLGTNWSKWKSSSSNGVVWKFTSNFDFSLLTYFQIYTEASVSSYAGVNMRKTNIGGIHGSFTTSNAACYYWPCLIQYNSSNSITAVFHPQNYNGMLTASQTQGDMPGTLSVNTLGTMSYYGYNAGNPWYFAFVVTNTSDIETDIHDGNYGILYNAYFKVDPVIRVVASTVVPPNAYIGQ